MNGITEFYGRDEPSASYKWGVAIPLVLSKSWSIIAWFKTRKRAEEYGKSRDGDYAVVRLGRIAGRLV